MATVDKHELLFSTNIQFFKALQLIGGKSIFDRYNIAKSSVLGKYIDEEYRFFLAYPVKIGDKVEFHGIKSRGDAPQALSEIEGDDANEYEAKLNDSIKHYRAKIDQLRTADKKTEAEYLEDAIKSVDKRFVFCYDDKVVLGAWGMQIRENVRENINEIRKKVPRKKNKEEIQSEPTPLAASPLTSYEVRFNSGEGGDIEGQTIFSIEEGKLVSENEIPKVIPKEGYQFIGWDENPNHYNINANKEFTAQYKPIPPPVIAATRLPWWKRFWLWLTALFAGKGCLSWLLRTLLFLLLLLLLLWLMRNCHGCSHQVGGGDALSDNDSTWLHDDPNVGNGGGIYDPHDPYTPVPTPPDYGGVLPPQQGVLPPIDDSPEIIPGNPSVFANKLNILMDNHDKSIMDLAKDFKDKYPDDKYKVVYYDDIVKRMQIEIPKEEREQMKQEIPAAFAPDYELFVFDEALFEAAYLPNDPAINDHNKSWYLKTIQAFDAWDITLGSENITIAIVDNGFNLKHPELNSKVVQPYNVWLHSKDIFPQRIDHGTHVAGIALAIADNNLGISGIAPKCKFMPVQVANEREQMTTTSVLDGILYALYQGADVINVSLGGAFTGLDQYGEAIQKELINNHFKEEERLWRHVMRIAANHNSTIVVASGNDNVLAGVEALQRPELFITVSAVDKKNEVFKKADFSNYGSYSDISAPGVDIFSSYGKDDYQTLDGTSMAAPIVSGAVALLKSLNNKLTTKQIICVLQKTGIQTQGGVGNLIQLDKALQTVKSEEVLNCTPEPSKGELQFLLSWNNYNDLDLIVSDPNGESVWFKNKRVSTGGQLEIDMNVEYPDSKTPFENVYWESETAPFGTYNVYLLYFKQHENNSESSYKIAVKYGDKLKEYSGAINNEKDVLHICSFALGDENQQSPISEGQNTSPSEERRTQLEQERDRLQAELDRVNNELRRIGNSR